MLLREGVHKFTRFPMVILITALVGVVVENVYDNWAYTVIAGGLAGVLTQVVRWSTGPQRPDAKITPSGHSTI